MTFSNGGQGIKIFGMESTNRITTQNKILKVSNKLAITPITLGGRKFSINMILKK